jgi:hypothetical protein
MVTVNGFHEGSITAGYSPGVAYSWGGWDADAQFQRGDVDRMDNDPRIQIGFRILCAPIAAATREVQCDQPEAKAFIERTIEHFWSHDLTRSLNFLKYGSLGCEPVYSYDEGSRLWEYARLKDFHLNDTKPLISCRDELVGVRVYNVLGGQVQRDGSRCVDLMGPSGLWIANEPKHSSFYGESRYRGAWGPWKEKTGKHGATDVRRTWMNSNATRGCIMRYPQGTTPKSGGGVIANQDLARQIVEQHMAGFNLAMENAWNEKSGHYHWDLVDAKMGDDNASILKYGVVLDTHILEGMGIWPEVLSAPEVGAGWSGRAIPFLMFLGSEDDIVKTVLMAFVHQVVRPLVRVNYGPKVRFTVKAVSLLPKEQPGQEVGMGGSQGITQVPEQVAQPDQAEDILGMNQGASLSLAMEEKAKRLGINLSEEARVRVQKALEYYRKRMAGLRRAS